MLKFKLVASVDLAIDGIILSAHRLENGQWEVSADKTILGFKDLLNPGPYDSRDDAKRELLRFAINIGEEKKRHLQSEETSAWKSYIIARQLSNDYLKVIDPLHNLKNQMENENDKESEARG